MKTAEKKETERILIAVAGALVIHIALFLIIEYTDIVRTEEPAEFVGPMIVEISQVTTIPESAEEADQVEPVEEEPFVEDPEALPAEPEAAPEDTTEERTSPDTDAPTVEEEAKEVVPPTEQSTTAEESEEGDTDYIVPTPQEQPETPPNEYNGSDAGNEYSIELGSVADSAQPIIGPSIAASLPDWTEDVERKIEIVFAFIIGPDGIITHLSLEKSSGYDEIDRIVRNVLRDWKFSRPLRRERVEGEITYVIKPREEDENN
jgi:TonB family protein